MGSIQLLKDFKYTRGDRFGRRTTIQQAQLSTQPTTFCSNKLWCGRRSGHSGGHRRVRGQVAEIYPWKHPIGAWFVSVWPSHRSATLQDKLTKQGKTSLKNLLYLAHSSLDDDDDDFCGTAVW